MKLKKTMRFLRKNYIITIFIVCILFVGVVVVARSYLSKPTYVYVKVKVGQGLWWVTTGKPSIWLVDAIKKEDVSRNLLGNPTAEILSTRYYRWYASDQYDIYMTLRLKVSMNSKTGGYVYNRSTLSVGSPIELQFPKEEVTGTVIELDKNRIEEKLVEKTIYLVKKYAYPWEFDNIKIGDKFFDGENTIFKIIDKQNQQNMEGFSFNSPYAGASLAEPTNYITVKATALLKNKLGQWVIGEDQIIVPGKVISISTPNFVFDSYVVSRVE